MISFDPCRHEYRDGEIIIRSVTQILKDAGIIDNKWYSEEARDRGSAVHDLCERYAQGKRVDNLGRPLAALEYVNAFANWIHLCHVYAIETEKIITGEINGHRYAGRFDLKADINGKTVMVDIKTGKKAKWHKIQLAAYTLSENTQKAMELYLHPDGAFIQDYLTPSQLLWGIEEFKKAIAKE
jgi:RecB family exonuclease